MISVAQMAMIEMQYWNTMSAFLKVTPFRKPIPERFRKTEMALTLEKNRAGKMPAQKPTMTAKRINKRINAGVSSSTSSS